MNDADSVPKTIPPGDEQEHVRFTRLRVSGMYCPICVTRIHDQLVALDGVFRVEVNQQAGVADVIFDSHFTTVPSLIQAVSQAGDEDRYSYRAVIATAAEANPSSNTLPRSARRPHRARPR
jgi:copper chaperone CopZ